MKNKKRLTWWDLIKWGISDQLGRSYSSEEKSRFYDRLAQDFFHRDRLAAFITKIISDLHTNTTPYICERAAGSGIITEHLYQQGFTKIRTSDLNATQLLVLQEKMPEIKTVVEDFNFPLKDIHAKTFDVILQVGATRFMTKKGQIIYIEEAFRTLHNGGYILWPVIWAEMPMAWLSKGWNPPKTTPWGIKLLLEKNGFEIIENPFLIHGKIGLLTTTFLVAQKNENPKPKNIFTSFLDLSKKIKIRFLKK